MNNKSGITLFEIILGIALLVVIAGLGIVSYNPAGQMAAARNKERELGLQTLLVVIRQNVSDSMGAQFMCGGSTSSIPAVPTRMSSSGFNIAPCLIPAYLPVLPVDPFDRNALYEDVDNYDTGYYISRSATSGAITLSAPSAELGKQIKITR
jgi:type II secretory pathway pseudopilin PulG